MHLTDDQLNKVTDALLAGNKIAAIKIYREVTGLGLAEAKTQIERIETGLGKEHPELLQAQKKGCTAVIAAGIFITLVIAAATFGGYGNVG